MESMREIKFRVWDRVQNKMLVNPPSHPTIGIADLFNNPASNWTWMQFTGVLDVNGKEVYEDDIVHVRESDFMENGYEYNQRVEMANGYWRPTMMFIVGNQVEIIGNVYENPELLTSLKI